MRIIYSKTTFRNVIYRALISIAVGIVLVAWPDVALKSLVMFIGFLFLLSGVMSLLISYRQQQLAEHAGGVVPLNGLGSILLGVLLISIPLFFTTVLMFLLGCVLLLAGTAQLATLSMARQLGKVASVNYLYPVVILLAGLVVIFKPWGSAAYVVIILGCTAIFYGITDLISQYQINKLRKLHDTEEHQHRGADNAEIEDAEYEEVN
ncbi:HdeD family acid-resistance protein [Odoribacter lunatus]|uniref:HdeD family acid-resistance protein n=1 Tax=Odoribacter lunatus TaxID=2941335 RepID=UPI00203F5347|nr:DUF308 domain-containing protein [Odoribacter lunatus]